MELQLVHFDFCLVLLMHLYALYAEMLSDGLVDRLSPTLYALSSYNLHFTDGF